MVRTSETAVRGASRWTTVRPEEGRMRRGEIRVQLRELWRRDHGVAAI